MRHHYQPFTIGKFLIVPPEWPRAETAKQLLVMERGAFGSGEHETTRSCIELLDTLALPNVAKCLDLGSGTGILSIATLLLNPEAQACCVDIEAAAVESCRANCRLNRIDSRARHMCGTLADLPDRGFDLILANIYGDILLDLAQELVERAKIGAWILLSGILWEYNFDVKQAYQRLGCRVVSSHLLSEFATLLLQKE